MLQKIRNKSKQFWKHGKHKVHGIVNLLNRKKVQQPEPVKYGSVKDLFEKEKGE